MFKLASHRLVSRIERSVGSSALVDTAISESGTTKDGVINSKGNEQVLMESYEKSIWVYTTVSMLAEIAAQVPLKIHNKAAGKLKDVTMDERVKVLRHPNPWMSRYKLWEATISYLRLCGNCYWEVTPNKFKPEFIYILRPDLMKIVLDDNNYIKQYNYYKRGINSADPVPFHPENIVHFRSFNPMDSFYGMSSLTPAQLSVAADRLALLYQIKFYENNARPDGVFRTDSTLSDTQIERLEKKFIQFRQKLRGAFSPIILHSGLEYQPVSSNLKDIELPQARKVNRQDIMSGQRTLPGIAGLEDADMSGIKEQMHSYMYMRIMPTLRSLSADLDTLFLRYIDKNFEASFDAEELPEYLDELEQETKIRIRFQNGLIDVQEARAALKLGPLKDEKANKERFILSTMMRIDDVQSINDQNVSVGGRNQRPDSEARNDDDDPDAAGNDAENDGSSRGDSERT